MSRVFITGSTDGLGRAAARALIDDGHEVVLHARSPERAEAFGGLASRAAKVVVGDLSSVPTKMGGPGAPDDLELGYPPQTWLAISEDPAARLTGRYWHHRRTQSPARHVSDPAFQDQVVAGLAGLTGLSLV